MNKFLFLAEAPAASFSREFATIKSLSQYKRRNPNLKGEEYTFYEGNWVRFVIYGSTVIPEPVLRSLLNSVTPNSENNLFPPPAVKSHPPMKPQPPHPEIHVPHNPLN